MTRTRFFLLRLLPTAVSLLLTICIVELLWFPGAYSTLAGISGLLLLFIVTNVALGPGLTTLVYRPGKRGLAFDIVVLAVVELTALALAGHALYQRQPVYTVFAVDRFEVVTAPEIDRERLAGSRLARRPAHEPRLIYAALPEDPAIFDRLLDETVILGMPDIDRRPEFWQPYPAGIAALRSRAKPLADLLRSNDAAYREVSVWLQGQNATVRDYLFLPIRGRARDGIMIVSVFTGYPVDILAVDPW